MISQNGLSGIAIVSQGQVPAVVPRTDKIVDEHLRHIFVIKVPAILHYLS